MKNKSLFLISLILISSFLLLATPVLGESSYTWEVGIPGLAQKGKSTSVESGGFTTFAKILIKWAFRLAGVLAFAMIIFAGLEYAVFSGAPEKQKDAQNRIINAIVGLLLLFSFWLILNTVNPDILKTKEPTLKPVTLPSTSNSDKNLEEYLQEQKDTLNKLRAAANIFISEREIKASEYEKITTPSTRSIVDKTNYLPAELYLKALKKYSIVVDPVTYPHGASCDYYIATVMRSSGLDPEYPPGNVEAQYKHVTTSSKYQCKTIECTNLDCCKNVTYLTQNQARNGSILFYDHNTNCSPDHTALWIDGNRLQASLVPAIYPMNRGTNFNPPSYPVMAICTYKGL